MVSNNPMRLEWRTQEEEDGRSREETPDEEARAPKRRGRPWWLWSLFALLLAAAIIWGVRYVLIRRLEAISAAIEAEVLAMHGIVQQAERDNDGALFGSMISSDYPNWGGSQKRMFSNGMRWDRAFFGLNLDHGADDEPPTGAVEDIVFTSDWRMATVTLAFPYEPVRWDSRLPEAREADRSDGPPVTLHQTVTYREGMTGWALVPAYPAFWGENRTVTGRYLTVEYPERDAATVERLARDWDEMLAAACEELDDLRCGRNWKLKVVLDTESGSLVRMADGAPSGPRWMDAFNAPLTGQGANASGLKLPTPSLIGRPVDEAGYEVMRAGYAPLIMGGGIADLVGWRCCDRVGRARARRGHGAVFFRALLDKQLSQLGLIPWPVTASTYEEILQGPIHDVANLNRVYLWRSGSNITPHIWKIVYSMVDFILAGSPEQSPAALQRALLRFETYRPWLLNAGFNSYGRSILKEWIRYADQQLAASTATGSALPAQDLQLLCATERSQDANVYRYATQSGAFTKENVNGAFRRMYALPGADGVLLQRTGEKFNAAASGSPVLIWRHTQERAQNVAYLPGNTALFAVETFADGMLFYAYDTRQQPVVLFNYLNLAECDGGACALQALDGFPVWPPARDRTIVSRGDGVLWLGNEKGEPHTAVARGRSAAWLDDERVAFIQPDEGMRVKVMTLPHLETGTLLEMGALAETLRMSADGPLPITPVALATHPTWPDRLFIAARVGDGTRTEATHIFAHSLDTGEITELLHVEHPLEPIRSLRFSADGRWLFIHSVERRTASWHLHLYNGQTGESLAYSSESTLAFPGYDLSADGAWLVRVDEGFLHLIPLHGGRQRLVAHDFAHCSAAVWVNRSFQ